MAIIDNLNTLSTNLDNAKFKLAKNLKDKGVQALPSEKLDALADKVSTIPSGSCNLQELNVTTNGVYTPQAGDVKGYNKVTVNVPQSGGLDWSAIGYSERPKHIDDGYNYAKQIYDTWDASQTDLSYKFDSNEKLVYMPLVDTSKATSMNYMYKSCGALSVIPEMNSTLVTNMSNMFNGCSTLTTIQALDTSSCENMYGMFTKCSSLPTIPTLNTSACTNMDGMFQDCSSIKTIPALNTSACTNMTYMFFKCSKLTEITSLDITSCENISNMFTECKSLKSIKFTGDPSKITNLKGAFGEEYSHLADNGTLIYDHRYDYSKIIDELHRCNPTWTAKADNAA